MAIKIDSKLTSQKLVPQIERVFELSAPKILSIEKSWKAGQGTPVFTVNGKYTSRGWTEWTQGFQYGSALLQFDAMGDERFLEIGRKGTVAHMASHVSHVGVHDHGFNNVSTYGNLLRLMREGKIPHSEDEKNFYELALKVSGAVQAARWTKLADGTGFIHSFNGPHSLFVDTIRSCRALAVAHCLGHVLMGEQDAKISLLNRLIDHALNTARYSVYYGEGRDYYDEWGRTTHEAVFNTTNGVFRCPNSQQGFAPFTTWTRGQAWAICGFAEQLEFFSKQKIKSEAVPAFLKAARATSDHYIANSCTDGIPMWDTGAPNLHRLGNYASKPSDPYNAWEPVDTSAAAIAAQGLVRLGNYLQAHGDTKSGTHYRQAGLTIARSLFNEPHLSTDSKHQGLLLHSVYHRPNGWDYIAPGQKVPNGESSMWGDYHARELALLLLREARGEHYLTFFGCLET
jgi:unsaturated chondroitin disaccharide hydrolase